MKIYLDLQKQAITKTTDENIYQGDIYSNAFEILFYNYTDSNWFPTMSQLAPNGRKAGEFTADALNVGESHEVTEDGVTYLKFDFTMGASWVLMKGRSEFYIWFNRLGGAIVQKKCVGVVNIMIDHSTEDYFVADPTFNPNVKTYIDACIAELGDGSPKYFDTASNIANSTEDKGLAVATDTGHLYYWDETKNSTTKYTDSGLVYNGLSNYYTKTQADALLANKADKSDTYTKTEINNYKKMWDNLVYSCNFSIDDSAKTMTISGSWAFTKYSFVVINDIAVRTISYASLTTGNYCLVIRNNALEFVNFANAIQDGDMVLWIGFLSATGNIKTDIYRCNNKVTNLALSCSKNIKIDTINKNFVIPNGFLFWNSGYASITAQNISYADYLNATCVLVYRNGVFKVLLLQNIELFYNDVIVAIVWFRSDGFVLRKIYVVNETPDKAFTELPLSSKIFMRVGVIGDSYTSGWIKDNAHKNNPNYSWVKYMKQLTGNEWTNFGVSGSSTKSWVDGTLGQLPQVQTKGNKCQAYVIGLMINDQSTGAQTYVPLGTSSDIGTNENSYYAYYYKLINALLSVNSSAIIFCNTCPRNDGNFPSYNQAVIDVVNYCQNESKKVYVIELRNYTWSNETFTNDALNGHYTAIGYEYMAEILNKAFSDTINANASSLKEINLIPYDSATVYDYVDKKINDLRWELGSHTLDVESDTDTLFSKSVPSGAIGCQINQVCGMSYKSENLFALQDVAETTSNGITYSVTNGVFSISGIATQRVEIRLMSYAFKVGTYSAKVFDIQNLGSVNVRFFADAIMSNSNLTSTTLSTTFSVQNAVTSDFGFVVPSGANVNVTFKYMLVSGSTAPNEYEPYFSGIRDSAVTSVISKDSSNNAIDTLTIPTAIQNLTGYGWGIDDIHYNYGTCYNYIDFEHKVFVQKVGRYTFTGNENVIESNVSNNDKRFLIALPNCKSVAVTDIGNGLFADYDIKSGNDIYNNNTIGWSINAQNFNFYDSAIQTLTAFKTFITDKTVYYELATPVEIDISAYLTTDTIDVEPLGTLEFTNTYSQDVPSDIDYLIEEVKA